MDKKQFWRNASNMGLVGGAAMFVVNLIGWALKLETGSGTWIFELLLFLAICPLIAYTGRRNAVAAGPEGYGYGRAVGFVFAMMMFAGIVYGVGRFLLTNYIAADYYEALNSYALDEALEIYRSTPLYDRAVSMRTSMMDMLRNPFYLIFSSVLGMVARGGFLGLILCAFFAKKSDLFAGSKKPASDD